MRQNLREIREDVSMTRLQYDYNSPKNNVLTTPVPGSLYGEFYDETLEIPLKALVRSATEQSNSFVDRLNWLLFGEKAPEPKPTVQFPGRHCFAFTFSVPIFAGSIFHEAYYRFHSPVSQRQQGAFSGKFNADVVFNNGQTVHLYGCFVCDAPYLSAQPHPYNLVVPLSVDHYVDVNEVLKLKMRAIEENEDE